MQHATFKHLNKDGLVVKHDLAFVGSHIHIVARRGHADIEEVDRVLMHVVLFVNLIDCLGQLGHVDRALIEEEHLPIARAQPARGRRLGDEALHLDAGIRVVELQRLQHVAVLSAKERCDTIEGAPSALRREH